MLYNQDILSHRKFKYLWKLKRNSIDFIKTFLSGIPNTFLDFPSFFSFCSQIEIQNKLEYHCERKKNEKN